MKPKWWQQVVFYQIYPRSFADSNGDGIGDINGIRQKLGYLKSLGIGAIWLSPHYPSPMVDCGYDVSDYCGVAPEYGSMEEFTSMIHEAHDLGIKVILDLVLNHTSDQHPWFLESKSSFDNPKRNWYIWKKGKNDGPPNDWNSPFGGSAWEYDASSGEYYYHFFFKEQPDLNWENPQVQQAMWDVVRFWLNLGVDGFRLDAVGTIFEVEDWRDHNQDFTLEELYKSNRLAQTDKEKSQVLQNYQAMFHYQWDQPRLHDVTKALRRVVNEFKDRVLLGETDDISLYGNGQDELHMVFNFPLLEKDKLTAKIVAENQQSRLPKIPVGGWAANTLGNHDSNRSYSKFGDGINDTAIAKLNLLLMLTLRGTPVLYYGEEIGMTDLNELQLSDFRDTLAIMNYEMEMKVMGRSGAESIPVGVQAGRDKCRTPMQWDNSINAGFCPEKIKPWLPVNGNFAQGINVRDQQNNPESILSFYERAISFRNEHDLLQYGDFHLVESPDDRVLIFERELFERRAIVALNFRSESVNINSWDEKKQEDFSTVCPSGKVQSEGIILLPFEGRVYLSDKKATEVIK
jgi:alpha-glucosidase